METHRSWSRRAFTVEPWGSSKKCAKDNDTEAELLANYFIGETLFIKGCELEKPRAHLVDFQMKDEKSPEIQFKFKKASHMINQIMTRMN